MSANKKEFIKALKKSRVTRTGEPLAIELYAIISPWVNKYAKSGDIDPNQISIVAKEVVETICMANGFYYNYHRKSGK